MAGFPPKSQRDQLMVLVTIVGVALGMLYWNFVWKPKDAALTAVAERVDALESANQRAKAELARGNADQLREEAENLRASLNVMRQLVPTGNEVPALLEQVSTAARRVNLDISSVEPSPVIEGDMFDTYRYKVTVLGSYHSIAEFLTNVGSLTRIIAPVNLALSPLSSPSDARQNASTTTLNTNFEIQTYVAKPSVKRAPAATEETK
ncbi:MAG TPA: type 4a pilus biogenesis protein PilO [Gemmatimonadaceae bacterium]|nr:type 4a pilus biogenesis protein PilO [Gemmatimonadaceae bacterium]